MVYVHLHTPTRNVFVFDEYQFTLAQEKRVILHERVAIPMPPTEDGKLWHHVHTIAMPRTEKTFALHVLHLPTKQRNIYQCYPKPVSNT